MASELDLLFLDHSLEKSGAGFRGIDLTAGNIVAEFAKMDTLVGAVQAIVLGTKVKDTRKAAEVTFTETRPVSAFAQREIKWLIRYTDNVTPNGNGTIEVPTADLQFVDGTGEYLDLTSTEGAAFETAFNDFQRSRLGNAVTLVSVQFVGRNL